VQAFTEVRVVGKRCLFEEIGRTPQFLEIGPTFRRLVSVKDGEGQVVDNPL
jgi:hypothetical protein